MTKVFVVTGGNGYIGSHMCKNLFNQGFEVHVIDNFSTSLKKPTHQYGTFHQFDIADSEKVEKLFLKIRPECVFHFAARALVGEGQENPMLYYQENVVKTLMLLNSCIETKVNNFVFSSTCATFGIPTTDTIDELHPQKPINTYGQTKLIMEMIMQDLALKKKLNAVVLRYFNAAGCSSDGDIGELHDPETHLIPNLCKAHLEGDSGVFYLNGVNHSTHDGTCIRDYIHVDDLCAAHFKAFTYISQKGGFDHFNLGSERGYSVKEVLTVFEKVTGKKLVVKEIAARPGDPSKLVANSDKAKKELGFNCQYDLNACINHTLKFLTKIHS